MKLSREQLRDGHWSKIEKRGKPNKMLLLSATILLVSAAVGAINYDTMWAGAMLTSSMICYRPVWARRDFIKVKTSYIDVGTGTGKLTITERRHWSDR